MFLADVTVGINRAWQHGHTLGAIPGNVLIITKSYGKHTK